MEAKSQNPKPKRIRQKQEVFEPFVFLFVVFSFFFFLFSFLGCSSIAESARGLAGVSTKALEENREDAIVSNCNLDYSTCFTKALDTLKKNGAYVYSSDIKKHRIACYVTFEDTTPVGIFFKETDAHNTQVEVSSQSTYAKELFAEKLFDALNKKK